MGNEKQAKIPVIDFSELQGLKKSETASNWVSVSKEVCHALEEYGCLVVTLQDKDCLELHHKIFDSLDELFNFPKQVKVENKYDKPFRGYHSPFPFHEGFGIDDAINPESTRNFTTLFWPNGNNHFCETADSYAKLVVGIDQMITRMIFDYYGAPKYAETAHIGSTDYVLRLHKYDEPKETSLLGNQMALPEHTDMNLTTIIHQNHVNGLEVRTKDGEWVGFDASPSSFIFMTGDAFQVWSNDRIKPCMHRVIMKGNAVRYSVLLSTFSNGIVSVQEELIDDKHPLLYKPLNHLEYMASQVGQTSRVSVKNFCGL